jgi:hypothetical protein
MPDTRAPEDTSPPERPDPPTLGMLAAMEKHFAAAHITPGYDDLRSAVDWVRQEREWREAVHSFSLDDRRAEAAREPRLPDGDPDGPVNWLTGDAVRDHESAQGEGEV